MRLAPPRRVLPGADARARSRPAHHRGDPAARRLRLARPDRLEDQAAALLPPLRAARHRAGADRAHHLSDRRAGHRRQGARGDRDRGGGAAAAAVWHVELIKTFNAERFGPTIAAKRRAFVIGASFWLCAGWAFVRQAIRLNPLVIGATRTDRPSCRQPSPSSSPSHDQHPPSPPRRHDAHRTLRHIPPQHPLVAGDEHIDRGRSGCSY